MKRVSFLLFLFHFLLFSTIKSQDISPFVFFYETLIDNEQLNSISQLIQLDADTPPVLNAVATIDRENRQISIEYKRPTDSEVGSTLYTYDEQGRPLTYVSYTVNGKQQDNERYTYHPGGSVVHRSMRQDTDEDTPKAERWTRWQKESHYDENNNLLDFSTKGVQSGKPFSSAGRYTYSFDDEGRTIEKISLLQDSLSGEFVPFLEEEWEYSNDKVRHTFTQLKSGKERVQTNWFEEGFLVKVKERSDDESSTTQLIYENGLLKVKHSSGDNELGSFDTSWIYEYK